MPLAALFVLLTLSAAMASAADKPKAKNQPAPVAPANTPLRVEAATVKTLKARSIGPAVMGGRVSDVAFDPKDLYTFYIGLATGGVMKTTDDGASFQGLFDKEAVASIGAVAVAPSDPKVLWVGTGEANDRNSSAWGNGVYRSEDAGATWVHVGLADSRAIARIVVHPSDPKTAWVAAAGHLWVPSPGRGIFKTTDGGATWKTVLSAPAPYADRVGGGELAIDPGDPSVLYASLYARRRTPWSFTSGPAATDGKDLGGVFKSRDGGSTWRRLDQGLPRETARIGLAVFPKNPKVVYAVVDSHEGGTSGIDNLKSKRGGVFRSEDAGETWTRMSGLTPRAFYFSQIRVDPESDQRVYLLGYALHVSEDGGKSFREDRFAKVHPDVHALAIDPRSPKRLLLGTDGGAYLSVNGAEGWEHLARFAAGEFYRISADRSTPYRLCGGLQDNLNWVGPSRTSSKEGILNSDWINIGGGDGFYCVFDHKDKDIVYAESQEGYLHRMHLASGEIKGLRPEPAEGQPGYRFHWNSPLIGSRHQPGTLYLAGNRVFKLTEQGEHWTLSSPDLSAQELAKTTAVGSGAENFGVVYTLAESPVKAGLLWAGTDDGKVWITEDAGTRWADLTGTLPAAVNGQWVSRIEASAVDPKVAYLAVDAHRTGNDAPLLYRTADLGRTWQALASDLPANGPVKVVREDPLNPRLLYAGTEFGLFASFDQGGHWLKLGQLPTVAVDDILVQPDARDLVIATHGRSLYIIDDLRPLQELTPEVLAKEAHLFEPRPALATNLLPGFVDWAGNAVFRGENPPEGAVLTYHVKETTADGVKISIENAGGQPVANLTGPGYAGLNRVTWDLKPAKDLLVEYGGEGRKFVRAGEYKLTLTCGKAKEEQRLRVEVAPGIETR
ncbi:MAG TPA: hypothetical protein VJU18_06425 [Vicinamibacteria bacterium]|nr:hypothetical protein [Vicinamibacteria bacterium]